MPKVYLHQEELYSDITHYISKITWAGGKSQVARRLELDLINSVLDKNIPDIYIKNGSMLKLFNDDGKLLFKGFVFLNSKSGQNSTVNVVAYDHLIYAIKNRGVYNFKKKTAEEIARTICNDFSIPIGNLAKTGIKQDIKANNKYIYDIFMSAYTGASKQNNKKYMAKIRDGKLDVIEIGSVMSTFMLSDESNIMDSGYTESIENMVNRVRIYDGKGNAIGMVENAEWIKKYGVLQNIYTKEKDKSAKTVAQSMLVDVQKTVHVTALGYIDCVTGNGVQLKDSASGLTGVFYIDSDTHTWSNGQHIMKLNLNFKNIMDEK